MLQCRSHGLISAVFQELMWPECLLQIGYVLMHVLKHTLMHVLMHVLMHDMHVLMRKLVDLCYVTTWRIH